MVDLEPKYEKGFGSDPTATKKGLKKLQLFYN